MAHWTFGLISPLPHIVTTTHDWVRARQTDKESGTLAVMLHPTKSHRNTIVQFLRETIDSDRRLGPMSLKRLPTFEVETVTVRQCHVGANTINKSLFPVTSKRFRPADTYLVNKPNIVWTGLKYKTERAYRRRCDYFFSHVCFRFSGRGATGSSLQKR